MTDYINSDFEIPAEYSIADEDRHYVDALMAIDPETIPGPNKAKGSLKLTADKLTLGMLNPAMQEAARAKMGAQKVSEADAVLAVMQENSSKQRALTGFAASASPYHHELSDIVRTYNDLLVEFDKLNDERVTNVRYETTDAGKPQPVSTLSVERLKQISVRQDEIMRHANDLLSKDGKFGYGASRRLAKAMFESVELDKKQARDRAVLEGAAKRSDEIVHNERVEELAEALANRKRRSR